MTNLVDEVKVLDRDGIMFLSATVALNNGWDEGSWLGLSHEVLQVAGKTLESMDD